MRAPAILDPFGDATFHSIETPRIWLESTDSGRMSRVLRAAASGAVCVTFTGLIAPGETGHSAGARCIFPLGFARESVRLAGDFAQPLQVLHRIIPTQI